MPVECSESQHIYGFKVRFFVYYYVAWMVPNMVSGSKISKVVIELVCRDYKVVSLTVL